MILGEITGSEMDWIKGALLALPTIASAVTAWFVITGKGKTPQPLLVKGERAMATKEELEAVAKTVTKVEGEVRDIQDDMLAMERRLSDEGKARVGALHRRMDEMQKDVGNVPARTVAMLKDAKGILP